MTDDSTVREQIAEVLERLYDAFVAKDRTAFDSVLADDVTVWESHFPHFYDRAGLDQFRAWRDVSSSVTVDDPRVVAVMNVVSSDVEYERIDAWGGVALACYTLSLTRENGETNRWWISEIFTSGREGWKISHRHAEFRGPADALDDDARCPEAYRAIVRERPRPQLAYPRRQAIDRRA